IPIQSPRSSSTGGSRSTAKRRVPPRAPGSGLGPTSKGPRSVTNVAGGRPDSAGRKNLILTAPGQLDADHPKYAFVTVPDTFAPPSVLTWVRVSVAGTAPAAGLSTPTWIV